MLLLYCMIHAGGIDLPAHGDCIEEAVFVLLSALFALRLRVAAQHLSERSRAGDPSEAVRTACAAAQRNHGDR